MFLSEALGALSIAADVATGRPRGAAQSVAELRGALRARRGAAGGLRVEGHHQRLFAQRKAEALLQLCACQPV